MNQDSTMQREPRTESASATPDPASDPSPGGRPRTGWILLPIAILALAAGGGFYFIKTRPQPEKRPRPPMTGLVRTVAVTAGTERIAVPAMGTVIPARQIVLKARVSGEIVDVHPEFREGGRLAAGETAVRIDPQDYELAVIQREADVARAEFDWKLEQGYQVVARREWSLLQGDAPADGPDAELALRRPHLARAQGALAGAQAQLAQAKINLERTAVTVPFDVVVRSRQVDLGAQVSPQDPLATLADATEFWVQAALPVDRLRWVALPQPGAGDGAVARIWNDAGDPDARRTGRVIRRLSDLETTGRNARVLVAVSEPLDGEGLPLLLGSYVRVEIEGPALENVVRLPRPALREDGVVWLYGTDNTLEIRPVSVAWRDADSVLIDGGLGTGDQVVVSDLAAPVPGMPLQRAGVLRPDREPGKGGPGEGSNGDRKDEGKRP